MNTRAAPGRWLLVGVVAGWCGLALSWFVASGIDVAENPVVAVAETIIRHLPGSWIENGIQTLGHHDKDTMIALILVVLTLLFALIGLLGRRDERLMLAGWVPLTAVGAAAVIARSGGEAKAVLPVAAGFVAWVGVGMLLATPLRIGSGIGSGIGSDSAADGRDRRFVLRAGLAAVGAGVLGLVAPELGRTRREVAAERASLRLPGVTRPQVPDGADLGIAQPWATPASSFYRVDTTFSPPQLTSSGWALHIHGMVDHEITLTFEDLLQRRRTESWITLNCVSNEVGGDLIGNAWWSGVLLAPLLREAGVSADADAVLQTSHDGWTCGTPLAALTDDRGAMLAVAMNGEPLPVEHGYPVRTVVPGLFGYVSACKWVVDLEVTTFDRAVGYWIPLGWAPKGPVKLASRIDRPSSSASVPAGRYTFAGVAWEQDTGISAVHISIDGGPWLPCDLGTVPSVETWVQWSCTTSVPAGHHSVAVRATDRHGVVQTGVRRQVLPDGATGWHTVTFTAS